MGSAVGMKTPAVRMRYTRLMKYIEENGSSINGGKGGSKNDGNNNNDDRAGHGTSDGLGYGIEVRISGVSGDEGNESEVNIGGDRNPPKKVTKPRGRGRKKQTRKDSSGNI